ncbi:MAG: 2TM domain-containing protein [Flavobacterium sp.]|nr:2TM domain-containing protein [Flavobacterium sp.]
METINKNSEKYQYAKNRVKKIKGFYIHFTIYMIINSMIILGIIYDQDFNNLNFWSFETFSTALFWGIGLFSHGISVFGKDLIFNKNWEQKKIQEFMAKENKTNWE